MKTRQLFNRCLTPLFGLMLLMGVFVGGAYAAQPTERQAKAMAMWQERCKTAGEKIYKTVEGVEGIYILKLRAERPNHADQFAMNDPYGKDLGGKLGYIGSFVRGEFQATHKGISKAGSPPRLGYRYVEAEDPTDGRRYRYTGLVKEVTHTTSVMMGGDGKTTFRSKEFLLDRTASQSIPPRYGVTYDDISTREEREYWIAGSSLRIIDLKTNAVIAERIGYMVDLAQGSRVGGRSPWLFAADNACPKFADRNASSAQAYQALDFVEKILRPAN